MIYKIRELLQRYEAAAIRDRLAPRSGLLDAIANALDVLDDVAKTSGLTHPTAEGIADSLRKCVPKNDPHRDTLFFLDALATIKADILGATNDDARALGHTLEEIADDKRWTPEYLTAMLVGYLSRNVTDRSLLEYLEAQPATANAPR